MPRFRHPNRWRLVRRIALTLGLVVCVAVLNVLPTKLVMVGPPQAVETLHPKVGVHTRMTDEVEAWKIQRTCEMVRQMGSPWIVEYFPWGYYEPSKGRYDWSHPDLVIDHATAQGLTVLARIDFVPEWARPEKTTYRHLDVDRFGDYAAFVAAFAARYAGRVEHLIIWNEPNLSFEWGYRPPDPEAYTELLRQAYLAAKEANPDVQVLMAGLAPTTAPEGNPWGLDDLIYLQRVYDAGGGQWMDGLAVHAYGLTFPADEPPDPGQINFRRVELTRQVMVANGAAEMPIYVTEGGWNDNPRWTKAVRPYQRIGYTLQAYELAESWPWCEAVCMWVMRFPWPQSTHQDSYAFVTPEFIPKPIYVEVGHYAHGEPYEYWTE